MCSYPLVATVLLTGGRSAEIVGLETAEVSFDRKTVTIRPDAWLEMARTRRNRWERASRCLRQNLRQTIQVGQNDQRPTRPKGRRGSSFQQRGPARLEAICRTPNPLKRHPAGLNRQQNRQQTEPNRLTFGAEDARVDMERRMDRRTGIRHANSRPTDYGIWRLRRAS
jgi:integrase